MADLKVTRFVIGDKAYAIPTAGTDQNGLMTSDQFSKLAGISAGAQVNVIEGVKVNGTALAIASKLVDILIASGSANGTIAVNGVDVAVKGLAALAYKANVSESDLDTALKAVLDAKALQTDVDDIRNTIASLSGTGSGSLKQTIDDAINDFATKVSDDNVVNSYKELIDWVAVHGGEAAEMSAAITKLENIVAGIGGTDQPATVNAAIQAAVNAINIGNYYNKTEVDGKLDGKVDKVDGYGLSKNDFTDVLKTKLDGIEAGATKNTVSYDESTQTLTLTGFSA